MKIRNVYSMTDTVNRIKRQDIDQKKKSSGHLSNIVLVYKIYKEFLKLSYKKTNASI